MERYEKYKDSGIEWIGEMPEEWETAHLGLFLSQFTTGLNPRDNFELSDDGDYYYVTIQNFKDGVLYLDDKCDKIDSKAWKLIQERSDIHAGDILFASISHNGQAFLVKEEPDNWNINESVFKLRFRKGQVLPNYAYYVLTSDAFYNEMASDSTGTTFKSIKQNKLKKNYFPKPSIPEQHAIVDYLDKKTGEIDQEIADQENQIALLEELKQSIITHAITKGLDSTAKMKSTGIDWIGDVPEGWEVKALKYCLRFHNGKDYKDVESEDGYPVLGSGGAFAYATEYLYDGEVVLLGRKGTIDKPLYYNGPFWSVDTMFYATPRTNNCCKFLYYSAKCIPFARYVTATALPSMTQTDLGGHKIAIPPLVEQQAIADYLDAKTSEIDREIEDKKQQIALLEELKQAVISQAVTGKIKVS